MATTTTVHAQFIKYASNGDQPVLHLENTGADVKINRSSNPDIPSSVTNVQQLVNALGKLAFSDGVSVSGLTTGNFAAGVITTDLNVSESGKIADARALKTINDKIKSQEEKITALNSNFGNLKSVVLNKTLLTENWSGTKVPYTQVISIGTEYTEPEAIEIVQDPTCTDTQNIAFFNMVGGPGSLSDGNLTVKIYGKKPSEDIPILVIVRGEI